MAVHNKTPIIIDNSTGNIAKPPLSSSCGQLLVRSDFYSRLWRQQQQLFTYSGPGGDSGSVMQPREDEIGYYYIIIPEPFRASGKARQLGGAAMLWAYEGASGSAAKIEWIKPGVSSTTLWSSTTAFGGNITDGYTYDKLEPLPEDKALVKLNKSGFETPPDTGADYILGIVLTTNCFIAALSVWTMPDPDGTIDNDDVLVGVDNVKPDRVIRGYDATDPIPSIGDINRNIRDSDYSAETDQTVANRCLLQSGHPIGITTSSSSYVSIRVGQAAYFRVKASNIRNQSTVEAVPTIVWSCTGAGEGDPARVRYTSLSSGDTYVFESETDKANALSIATSTITISGTADDYILIEFHAPTSGTVEIATFALWEELQL